MRAIPSPPIELAQLYETGFKDFVPRNVEVARKLYERAAAGGMEEAKKRLKSLPQEEPAKLRPAVDESKQP